jgi:hypothetical protein
MILGECPYGDCDGFMLTPIADRYGFSQEKCPDCNRVVWIEHTRIGPSAYTDEGFREAFDVDDEKKTIKRRESEAE